MPVAVCPECDAEIDFGNPVEMKVGDQAVCPECGIELEVISTKPLTLDYFLDEDWEEDWEEDWDDE